MAKKVIEKAVEKPEGDDRDISVPVMEKIAAGVASAKSSPEPGPRQDIPAQADRILKTFSCYPELYIDLQGGIFTVDTPPVFRSNATRYKNPYHKRP